MPERPLTRIPGIGPATARVLTENGFASTEAIARATPATLAKVPGFGPARAAVILDAARSLLSAGEDSESAPLAAKPDKKKGKKKKDKKGKGKGKKKKDKKGKKKRKKKRKK